MHTAKIYCDTCDKLYAEVKWDDIPLWHNSSCQHCGDILINDADMAVYHTMNTLIEAGLAQHPQDDEPGEGMYRAKVSTRHGQLNINGEGVSYEDR